jgi:hypothetical protein
MMRSASASVSRILDWFTTHSHTIYHELDRIEPCLVRVRKAAFDDVGNPVRVCVWHDNRLEAGRIGPIGRDHCRLRAAAS